MPTATKTRTLHDYLSHLKLREAEKLLGPEGKQLIQKGSRADVDPEGDVRLDGNIFILTGPEPDVAVTIRLDPAARGRLLIECTGCGPVACHHKGTALNFILEHKTLLGLAEAPPERVPVEPLGDEELVARAISEREERASEEKMRVTSQDRSTPWADYLIASAGSGKTYRVALRGFKPGESFCTCPDFRKNTLGTCKHILHVAAKVRRRFTAKERALGWQPDHCVVSVAYVPDVALRLECPNKLPKKQAAAVAPFVGKRIDKPRKALKLLAAVRELERLGHEVTIYPDAEEMISRLLHQHGVAKRMAAIRKDPAKHPLRKELLSGATLLPYQLDGIAFATSAGRAVLADDMGLGKTIQGIGVAEMLAREADIKKVLVICPASLKSQWAAEVEKFSGRSAQIVLGSAESRPAQYACDAFLTICNYEQVLRDILAIETVPWDLIILDEGQRIKNWESKTSNIVKSLRSPYALVLSGTPLENRLDDLFSVVEFIDDRRLGAAFRFFNRHRVTDEKGKVLGYKDLAALREALAPVLLRRTRASVLQDLPPRSTEIVRIAPTDEQAELCSEQMRIVSSIVRKRYINEMDLMRLQKAMLLARMAADSTYLVYKEEGGPGYSSKLARLGELLGDLAAEDDRKIVLFSEWTTMLDLIEPLLDSAGLRFVRLDGSVPQKQRQQIVAEFREDPACRVFITTNAGSTGLNLQAANTVINVDLPWNPAVLEQRIARAHRMGQKRPVQVYVLITEGTIEENLLGTLSAKHELAQAALDPDSDIDSVDLATGIDELKARLEILLGTPPEPPVDESQKAHTEIEAAALAERKTKLAETGGQLLGVAFDFLGQLLPQPESPADPAAVASIRENLAACVEPGEDGRPKLTISLPDTNALDRFAESLARLIPPR